MFHLYTYLASQVFLLLVQFTSLSSYLFAFAFTLLPSSSSFLFSSIHSFIRLFMRPLIYFTRLPFWFSFARLFSSFLCAFLHPLIYSSIYLSSLFMCWCMCFLHLSSSTCLPSFAILSLFCSSIHTFASLLFICVYLRLDALFTSSEGCCVFFLCSLIYSALIFPLFLTSFFSASCRMILNADIFSLRSFLLLNGICFP